MVPLGTVRGVQWHHDAGALAFALDNPTRVALRAPRFMVSAGATDDRSGVTPSMLSRKRMLKYHSSLEPNGFTPRLAG